MSLDLVFVAERLGEKGVSAAPSQDGHTIKDGTPSSLVDILVVRRALRMN